MNDPSNFDLNSEMNRILSPKNLGTDVTLFNSDNRFWVETIGEGLNSALYSTLLHSKASGQVLGLAERGILLNHFNPGIDFKSFIRPGSYQFPSFNQYYGEEIFPYIEKLWKTDAPNFFGLNTVLNTRLMALYEASIFSNNRIFNNQKFSIENLNIYKKLAQDTADRSFEAFYILGVFIERGKIEPHEIDQFFEAPAGWLVNLIDF